MKTFEAFLNEDTKNYSEMSLKEKLFFILEGHNDPVWRRNWNWLSIVTTPADLIGSLTITVGRHATTPRPRPEEVLELIKGVYCTFYHTGGYNPYHDLIKTRKYSRFQSISLCTIEQFVKYRGRQVPNSEVKFYFTFSDALKGFQKN